MLLQVIKGIFGFAFSYNTNSLKGLVFLEISSKDLAIGIVESLKKKVEPGHENLTFDYLTVSMVIQLGIRCCLCPCHSQATQAMPCNARSITHTQHGNCMGLHFEG